MVNEVVRIGEWVLHRQLSELSGPEESVRLEPRTCAVLVALAERAGEVCSREELLDAVWGDAFVGEAVLTHSIWELRRAFGDDAKKPRYIQTVPRRGYRLVAAVEEGVAGRPRLYTLLLSELADGPLSAERLGDNELTRLREQLAERAAALAAAHGGRVHDSSGGAFLLLFKRPVQAVGFARSWHLAVAHLGSEAGVELAARVAIHLCEMELPVGGGLGTGTGTEGSLPEGAGAAPVGAALPRGEPPSAPPADPRPLQVPAVASQLMALAQGGQTLLTRGAFDLARRASTEAEGRPEGERWLAHGAYLLPEVEGPVEIFEVGIEGQAPLAAPPDSAAARRMVGDGIIVGWRPAPGLAVPQRPHWRLERKLGEGGFGEVWLTRHAKTGEPRVFKFCYEVERLKALKREVTLFRLLKETLGERRDIARILDWNFDVAPYFLEMEHSTEGSLVDWAEEQGGLEAVPLATRLELVAEAAEALAAAHSVGVLHKDVKPANILVRAGGQGEPRACLTDFGIGRLTDPGRLAAAGVTALGLSQTQAGETGATTTGTRLYMAPEVLEGKAASIQADVYALGVVLYQMVVGDFDRVLAPGWRRDVGDELLAEDLASCVDGSPARRLASAAELVERLRQLESRRVARQAEERSRRVAAANRRALERARRRRALLAWVSVAALGVLAVVSVLALQAARARRAADASRDRAEGLVSFMLGDLRTTLAAVGRLDAMGVTAERVLEYYASIDQEEMSDAALARRVRALHQIGEVRLELGELEAARTVFERAVELAEELVGRGRDVGAWQAALADSRFWLATVALRSGDLEQAAEGFEAHRDLYAALVERDPSSREWRLELAYGHDNLGEVARRLGRPREALLAHQRCLELLQELVREEPGDAQLAREVATSHNRIGAVSEALGDLHGALASYRSALTLLRRLEAAQPDDAGLRQRRAVSESYVAASLWMLGEPSAAVEHQRAAVATFAALVTLDPDNKVWKRYLALTRIWLAGALRWQGEAEAAGEALASAGEILRGLVASDPHQAIWRRELAQQRQRMAEMLWLEGQAGAARTEIEGALELLREVAPELPGDRQVQRVLAECHLLRAEILASADAAAAAAARWRAVEILTPLV